MTKNKKKSGIFIILSIASMIFISGCASQPNSGYLENYKSAIADNLNDVSKRPKTEQELVKLFENLNNVFSDLKHPDLEQRIREAYAPSVYFNDTFSYLY